METIIKTSFISGNGAKVGYFFDRNADDDRVFEVSLDSRFNKLRWSDYEKKILDDVIEFVYENYTDYFNLDNDNQFFIV